MEVIVVEPGPRTLAKLEGPIDAENVAAFQRWLAPLCIPCQKLGLDVRHADFVDSAGVRALLWLQERLEVVSGELLLLVKRGSGIDRTLSLAQECGGVEQLKRLVDRLAGM